MTKEEMNAKITQLQLEFENNKKKVIKGFCDANNPYKVGDIFTDSNGSIIIDKIQYWYTNFLGDGPCCVYGGLELKKDGTPRKDGSRRQCWQFNEVKK